MYSRNRIHVPVLGLQNDQINIIQAFITEKGGGWKASSTQLPMTVGNFICIILTFLYGTLFIKFGEPIVTIPIICPRNLINQFATSMKPAI